MIFPLSLSPERLTAKLDTCDHFLMILMVGTISGLNCCRSLRYGNSTPQNLLILMIFAYSFLNLAELTCSFVWWFKPVGEIQDKYGWLPLLSSLSLSICGSGACSNLYGYGDSANLKTPKNHLLEWLKKIEITRMMVQKQFDVDSLP